MATIEDLEERVNSLEDALTEMAKTNVVKTEKIDTTSNKVDNLTPYTDTKTAYYGEKEKTFYNVPQGGNVTVMFDNYKGDYSVSRIMDRVTVMFNTLSDSTQITISII